MLCKSLLALRTPSDTVKEGSGSIVRFLNYTSLVACAEHSVQYAALYSRANAEHFNTV